MLIKSKLLKQLVLIFAAVEVDEVEMLAEILQKTDCSLGTLSDVKLVYIKSPGHAVTIQWEVGANHLASMST